VRWGTKIIHVVVGRLLSAKIISVTMRSRPLKGRSPEHFANHLNERLLLCLYRLIVGTQDKFVGLATNQ
jgi:hypothetical protein